LYKKTTQTHKKEQRYNTDNKMEEQIHKTICRWPHN